MVSTLNLDLFAANWSHPAADEFPPAHEDPLPPFLLERMVGSSRRPTPSAASPSAGAHATSSRSNLSPREMPPSVKPSAVVREGPTARSDMPTSVALMETKSASFSDIDAVGLARGARSPFVVVLSSTILSTTSNLSLASCGLRVGG